MVFHHSPCLREFEWRVTSQDDSNFDSVAFWHQLTSLTLDSSLSVGRMMNILASSVSLIHCDLRVMVDSPVVSNTFPIIHLPHLASFRLETSYQSSQKILDSMTLPSLSSFTLSVHWSQDTDITPLVVSSLLDRSCCALEHLSLQYLHMSEDDVIRCLQLSTDSLLKLRITDLKPFPVTDRTLKLLTYDPSSRSTCCPKLETIDIQPVKSTGAVFSNMVTSRQKPVSSDCVLLKHIFVRDPTLQEIVALKELDKHDLRINFRASGSNGIYYGR